MSKKKTNKKEKEFVPPISAVKDNENDSSIIVGSTSKLKSNKSKKNSNKISSAYPEFYNELANDNLQNDIPSADLDNI